MWIRVATQVTIATMTELSVSCRSAQLRWNWPMSIQVASTTGSGGGTANAASANDATPQAEATSMRMMVTPKANRSPSARPNAPAASDPASGARMAMA